MLENKANNNRTGATSADSFLTPRVLYTQPSDSISRVDGSVNWMIPRDGYRQMNMMMLC
jgi:hypothetical protein